MCLFRKRIGRFYFVLMFFFFGVCVCPRGGWLRWCWLIYSSTICLSLSDLLTFLRPFFGNRERPLGNNAPKRGKFGNGLNISRTFKKKKEKRKKRGFKKSITRFRGFLSALSCDGDLLWGLMDFLMLTLLVVYLDDDFVCWLIFKTILKMVE